MKYNELRSSQGRTRDPEQIYCGIWRIWKWMIKFLSKFQGSGIKFYRDIPFASQNQWFISIFKGLHRLLLTTGGYTIVARFQTHFAAPTTHFLLRLWGCVKFTQHHCECSQLRVTESAQGKWRERRDSVRRR